MRGERVTYRGEHFRTEDYQLRPAGTFRPRPTIYLGGESEPAGRSRADHADVWFINGQPLEDVAALIADVARRPAANGPLRYGLSAFVIARESDAEAEASTPGSSPSPIATRISAPTPAPARIRRA